MNERFYLVNQHNRTAIDLEIIHSWSPNPELFPERGKLLTMSTCNDLIPSSCMERCDPLYSRFNRITKWLQKAEHQMGDGLLFLGDTDELPWETSPIYPEWIIHNVNDNENINQLGREAWNFDPGGFYECLISTDLRLQIEDTINLGWTLRVEHKHLGATPSRTIEFNSMADVIRWYLDHQHEFGSWFRVLPRELMFEEPNLTLECPSCDDPMQVNLESEAPLIPAHCPFCMMAGGLVERQPNGRLYWYAGHPNVNME